jgi:hypothetical protein
MASAHGGHHENQIPEGATVSPEPLVCWTVMGLEILLDLADESQDTTLWIHIFVQMLAFGVLFPLGMVLGVRTHKTPSTRSITAG